MPTTIFDWIARTAMLAMAGLVTLSILGAIAAIGNDPGTRLAGPRDRPVVEEEPADERQPAQAPSPQAREGNSVEASKAGGQGGTIVVANPPAEDEEKRWLEAIAYALLALAGIGALGVLMLWNVVRELRRIGGDRR